VTYALSNTLSVKFGKYATLLGAEVIESNDNWNFFTLLSVRICHSV